MNEEKTPVGRVNTVACDIRQGDTIRIPGDLADVKVISRTYPDFTVPTFRVRLADGTTRNLAKSSKVSIADPDGSVASRVVEINLSYLTIGTGEES